MCEKKPATTLICQNIKVLITVFVQTSNQAGVKLTGDSADQTHWPFNVSMQNYPKLKENKKNMDTWTNIPVQNTLKFKFKFKIYNLNLKQGNNS